MRRPLVAIPFRVTLHDSQAQAGRKSGFSDRESKVHLIGTCSRKEVRGPPDSPRMMFIDESMEKPFSLVRKPEDWTAST